MFTTHSMEERSAFGGVFFLTDKGYFFKWIWDKAAKFMHWDAEILNDSVVADCWQAQLS